MDFSWRQNNISTCPICRKQFRQVITIEGCCHQFCLNCITRKIAEEGVHSCPVCNVDLGRAPLQKLRVGTSRQSTRTNFSERTAQPIDGDERAKCPFTRSRSLSRNEKQKHIAQGLHSQLYIPESSAGKPLGKTSINATRPHYNLEHIQGQLGANNYNYAPKLQQSTTEDNLTWTKQLRERVLHVVACAATKYTTMADERSNKKDKAFWFALVASDKQKPKVPLEQIPSRYLRVRNGNITVSYIKKYLVQKLNLTSENEMEISMQGRPLPSTLQICKLLNLWLHTTPTSETTKRAFVGCSAEEYVLTLTYGRKS